MATVIRRENEALQLMTRYVGWLDRHQRLPTPALSRREEDHICDPAALALGASGDGAAEAGARSLNTARLRSITEYVVANLARRDLSISTVAARQRLTVRQVQRLFESEGQTFTGYLLERRFYAAYSALADMRKRERSISRIARQSGFGDISYFNRAFRRRFGQTPRDARRVRQSG